MFGSAGIIAAILILAGAHGIEAHKPITSPFTYSADVWPIVRDRCGQCHAPGGVAPMSLLTHAGAVPWGESIRAELMAGHMPPWRVDRAPSRFRNAGGLAARELNVLLTWVTGGAPPGDLALLPNEMSVSPAWTLGAPDAILPLDAVTLDPNTKERVAEFVVETAGLPARELRAVDLLPGTPAIVRSATIEVVPASDDEASSDERLLSVWVPGDVAIPLERGAFSVPAGRRLRIRIRYQKTWEYERKVMTDQSRVGLYFAASRQPVVQALRLSAGAASTLTRDVEALAIYPDAMLASVGVTVTATTPGGGHEELIAFHPQAGWARRYWFREPVALPRGTRIDVRITPTPPALLGPGSRSPAPSIDPAAGRLTLNVVN